MTRCEIARVHATGETAMPPFLKNIVVAAILGLAAVSCDRMITPRSAQIVKDAESKTADGNFLRAITLYESALDDSPSSADVHYRLALLYDDKMHEPLHALHHFKRYLTLGASWPPPSGLEALLKR